MPATIRTLDYLINESTGTLKDANNISAAQMRDAIASVWFDRFDTRVYGAVADAREVMDAAITNGDATLTSATASFVAGDVGKSIGIEGAGATGLPLVTTILSITNSTTVELAANASATVSNARLVIGTDNTDAIQDAIDAAASTGGGKVYIPNGQYFVAGNFATATGATQANPAQINFPVIDLDDQKFVTIEIIGGLRPPASVSWNAGMVQPLHTCGTILISMRAGSSGKDAIFGGGYPTGATWQFTAVMAKFNNLTFRTYNNPKITPINLQQVGQADVSDCHMDNGRIVTAVAQPTNAAYGLILPLVNNWADVSARRINIVGFGTGVQWAEHANIDHAQAWVCSTGFELMPTFHGSRAGRLMYVGCTTGMRFTSGGAGLHRVIVSELAAEHTAFGDWRDTTTDIADSSNVGKGIIHYAFVLSDVGEDLGIVASGAAHLKLIDLSDALTAYGGSPGSGATRLFHFIADDLALADDTTVTTWTNASGTASNATATGTPKLRTNVVNGHKVVRFNGTDASLDGTLSLTGVEATLFYVAKWDSSGSVNDGRILGLRKVGVGQTDHGFGGSLGGCAFQTPVTTAGGNVGAYRHGSQRCQAAAAADAFHVVCIKFDGTNSSISIDGGAFSDVADTSTFDAGLYRIGADLQEQFAPSVFFKGDIAEISIYSGLRNSTEIESEITALGATYGITV